MQRTERLIEVLYRAATLLPSLPSLSRCNVTQYAIPFASLPNHRSVSRYIAATMCGTRHASSEPLTSNAIAAVNAIIKITSSTSAST